MMSGSLCARAEPLIPNLTPAYLFFSFSYTHTHPYGTLHSAKYVTAQLCNSPLLAHYLILLAHYHSRQPGSH